MTQTSAPWDGILIGDATIAPYSSAEWAELWTKRHGVGNRYRNAGVFPGQSSGSFEPLVVHASSPAAANVVVEPGAALVNGRFYENTVSEILSIQSNASGNARIDTPVIRLDVVAQTARLVVKQGTPAGSPVAPTMTQDASTWEIPLANIAVANGFSVINAANITARRFFVDTAARGWQAHAFPSLFIPDAASYSNSVALAANGGTLIVPFFLSGNMYVSELALRVTTTSVAYNIGWDVYIQDNNDLIGGDAVLRKVAVGAQNTTGTFGGAAATLGLTTDTQFLLTPGAYWVAVQNRHASNTVNVAYHPNSAIAPGTAMLKTTTNPNGATLDISASASWTIQTVGSFVLWLRGRVGDSGL